MKKLIITILAVCVTAICMTGCLGNNDDNSSTHKVTESEKSVMMNTMAGNYTGYMKYYKTSTSLDSVATTSVIRNDSILALDMPVSILANYVDSVNHKDIRNAIANAPKEKINLRIYIPSIVSNDYYENYQKGFYETTLLPVETTHSFSADGHKCEIRFSTTYVSVNYYNVYYPVLDYYNKKIQAFVLIQSITVDGEMTTINTPTVFYGSK